MIVVWRGLGLPIVLLGVFVSAMVPSLFGAVYVANHIWPRLFACASGAAVVYFLASLRDRDIPGRDSMYFIPVKVWAVLILLGGICWSFVPIDATKVAAKQIPQTQTGAFAANANVRIPTLVGQPFRFISDRHSNPNRTLVTIDIGQ